MTTITDRIDAAILRLLTERDGTVAADPATIPVGVSNRHVHLSQPDLDLLFGPGHGLTRKKAMKQPGQFAAEETVTLRGPKGSIDRVRVLGPTRRETQVEISIADGFVLGVRPPLRLSGVLDGTPGLELEGPAGRIRIARGVIAARRHLHMCPETARRLGLADGDEVEIVIPGDRGGVLGRVAVRASAESSDEFHVDVEEANAFLLKNDDRVTIRRPGSAAQR